MLTTGELMWILAAVARGDHDAFERLYNATRAKLYGVALRIVRRGEIAEAVVQESYLRIWRRAREFDPASASPMAWMVGIVRSRALDIVRKKGEAQTRDEPLASEAADLPDPLARRDMSDDLRRLLACMGSLDDERRRLILLAYFSGWTREELAVKFDKPVTTVRTWIRRSLLQIRECLES